VFRISLMIITTYKQLLQPHKRMVTLWTVIVHQSIGMLIIKEQDCEEHPDESIRSCTMR
jgi:hypothetical protein